MSQYVGQTEGQKIFPAEKGVRYKTNRDIYRHKRNGLRGQLPVPSHQHLTLEGTTRPTGPHHLMSIRILVFRPNGDLFGGSDSRKLERYRPSEWRSGKPRRRSQPDSSEHHGAVHFARDGNVDLDLILRRHIDEGHSYIVWDFSDS